VIADAKLDPKTLFTTVPEARVRAAN